ncbi:hypothetical protein ABTX62_31140 [Streptomyces sp. NPDC096046]
MGLVVYFAYSYRSSEMARRGPGEAG